jgi:hypothetical protein
MAGLEDNSVHIAQLVQKASNMEARFDKLEEKLDKFSVLDKAITELIIHRENGEKENQMLWQKIDNLNAWREIHERERAEERMKVLAAMEENCKTFSAACSAIETKVDGWVNRGKGALWVASIFVGFLQAALFSAVAWTFNGISDLNDRVIKLETEQRIEIKR